MVTRLLLNENEESVEGVAVIAGHASPEEQAHPAGCRRVGIHSHFWRRAGRLRQWSNHCANPYGFSAQQKMMLLPPIVAALEELGLEVWEPFAQNNQVDFLETGWAYRIGQRDFEDVAAADAIFAVVNGVPPDEGVMVELGMAVALRSPRSYFETISVALSTVSSIL